MSETIHEIDAAKSYEEDMVKYLIIVNRRRAIPDIIDGLKPVQRKVIYDMLTQGAISFKDRIKSSAVVGDTMKQYYGHGDCLRGNTKLLTLDHNLIDIRTIYESGLNEFYTLAVDKFGKVIPVKAHSFRIGQFTDKVYHIKLSNGFDLQCTSNHPILIANHGFVKAEDLEVNMRLFSKFMHMKLDKNMDGSESSRPIIGSYLLQNIIASNIYNKLEGQVVHHKDRNPLNNYPENLEYLSRSEHVKKHYQTMECYEKGLEKGRQEMFSPDGKFYEKTKRKNSLLATISSQNRTIIYFQCMIRKMKEMGIPLTVENYDANLVGLYRPPKFEKVYSKYGLDFESMVDYIERNPFNLGDEYRKQFSKPAFTFQNTNNGHIDTLVLDRQLNAIDKMIDLGNISYDIFLNIVADIDKIDYNSFINLLNIHAMRRPYIVSIEIEEVNQEPMYDFTVDIFENILIPASENYLPLTDIDPGIPLISVHNSSLYGAIEPLANWYKTKMPLIAAKGNWGDLMGHEPAASRYTEAGLSDFCYDCVVSEIKEAKTVVDWMDNYRKTTQEPEYLPVKVPLLLINGAMGIAVGLNSNIPTHNLAEVCEAARILLRDPNAKIMLYPDHCQPCKIIGEKKDFEHICKLGFGKYKVRGIVEVGEEKGYPMVYIKSLPDGVNSTVIVKKLTSMYANKELPMIQDISDATAGTVDIRIKLKKGADPGYMKQILYTKTKVQDTMSVNFEVVKGNNPTRIGYKEYLLNFIENRKLAKFRIYCNKFKVASTRYHQLDAYIKLIESGEIDNIIDLIKKQSKIDETELQEFLIKKIHVTDIQARFILDTDIRRLSKGYLNKYKEEFKILTNNMTLYQKAITDNGETIINDIDKELQEIIKKYGTPRITKIIKESDDSNIPKGVFKVVITKRNYLRKVVDSDKVGVVRGDDPKFIVRADNTENILLFDNMGKVFKMPVSKIPLVDKNGAGTDIRILNRSMTADIIAAYYEPTIQKVIDSGRKHYFVVASKNNTIKKLDMEDFLNVSISGLRYSAIKDNDEVAGIALAPADLDIVIFSKQKALRTSVKNIPLLKRNATGSKAMSTKNDIEGLSVLYPDEDYVAVVTEKGKVNKFQMSALSPHARGCAGINVIKLKDHDSIKSIYGASDNDTLRIITSNQTVEVPVVDIQSRSPVAAGDNVPLKGASIIRVDLMYKQK